MPNRKIASKTPTKNNSDIQRVLILRTCDSTLRSHGGFQWPKSGRVEAPDWKPTKSCGNGLHGFLRGEGYGHLASWEPDAIWIAAWVDLALVIDLEGKVKFPWADVAIAGKRQEATDYLRANGCNGVIIGSTLTGGDGSTLTGGYRSTLTGGDGSTLTGGDGSTLTGGDGSTLTGGDRSTLTGGHCSTLTIRYWNGSKYRVAVFEVGENGIEPNVKYGVDENGKPEVRR